MLTQKMKIPASLIDPVTATDLAARQAGHRRVHGVHQPRHVAAQQRATARSRRPCRRSRTSSTAAAATSARSTNGTTTARNAGMTNANTPGDQPGAGRHQHAGLALRRRVRHDEPAVAGAYDSGGWIYRDLGGNAELQPRHAGRPATRIPAPIIAARYGNVRGNGLMYKYGFDVERPRCGAAREPPGRDRPAVRLRPRAADRRQPVLPGVDRRRGAARRQRHPVPARAAGGRRTRRSGRGRRRRPQPAAAPIARGRAARRSRRGRTRAAATPSATSGSWSSATSPSELKAAVKSARLSKSAAEEGPLRVHAPRPPTLVMRNVRSDDPHARNAWVIRLMDDLAKRKVRADHGAGLERLGVREGRRTAGPPCSITALTAGGLVWSGPSGRSAGVALRGVREGCRPLGHSDRKHARARGARSLDRNPTDARRARAAKLARPVRELARWRSIPEMSPR